MKSYKKIFPGLILVLLCLFSLNGCHDRESEEREEEQALDAVSASTEGIVTAFTGQKITITDSDKNSLTFDMTKASLECKSGIIPGNKVTLIYVGPLDGTDTSKVRLRKIITSDDNSNLLRTDGTEVIEPSDSDSGILNGKAGYDAPASGVEVEAGTETVTVKSPVNVREDARGQAPVLGVLQAQEVVLRTGICENGWHRIVYEDQTGYVWGEFLSD